jgi:hypothetical protein
MLEFEGRPDGLIPDDPAASVNSTQLLGSNRPLVRVLGMSLSTDPHAVSPSPSLDHHPTANLLPRLAVAGQFQGPTP